MPGKKSKLTPLAARKQLLLMESQLNRAEFVEAVRDWKSELNRTREHLTSFGTIASLAAKAASLVPTISRFFPRRSAAKGKGPVRSWLKGMATGTSLWLLLRLLRHRQ